MKYFVITEKGELIKKSELKSHLQGKCDQVLIDLDLYGGKNLLREHRSWLNYIESKVPTIKKIALRIYYSEGFFVRLDLFAAESMSSAKKTYSLLDNSSIDLALKNGFTIVPNLHLSFQSRNIIYLNGYLDSKQYLRYWGENSRNLRRLSRIEMDQYMVKLVEDGVVIESEFDRYRKTMNTVKYQRLNVCPGFGVFYKWSMDEIIDLDKSGVLLTEIEDKIVQAFSIVGGLK